MKPKNPYWSLWGKLKYRHEQEEYSRMCEEDDVTGFHEKMEGLAEPPEPLRLPLTRLEVEWNGEEISVLGCRKKVKCDLHAVNFLKKLDNDAAYRREVLGLVEG